MSSHNEDASLSLSPNQGDTSSLISFGRVSSSIIKTRKTPASGVWGAKEDTDPALISELIEKNGRLLVPQTVTSRLLDGWVKYLSALYPVIHTPRLRELHTRKEDGLNTFEESMLHLVYANSGRVLEVVSMLY